MESLKAFLAALAPFLGKRLFAWLSAVAASAGVVLPWGEAQVAAFILSALSLLADGAIYWWRHRGDPKAMPAPTRNRALLVGINAYPGAELRGCVNDAKDNAAYLIEHEGFKNSEIVMLLDRKATTANIMAGLKWLAGDYQPGDRRFFAYSGHGTQMPGSREADGKFEAICPVDFDWTDAHAIRDTDFAEAFGKIPKGAIFDWVSDSCFSGGLADHDKALVQGVRSRAYPMPAMIAARLGSIFGAAVPVHADMNVGFVSGCKTTQTSADADIDGRPCGAFTHYWLHELGKDATVPMNKLTAAIGHDLAQNGFDQRPQVDGARAKQPFLR